MRDCLQPLGRNHCAARLTRPVDAAIDARQCLLDLINQVPSEGCRYLGVFVTNASVSRDGQLGESRSLLIAARDEQPAEPGDGVEPTVFILTDVVPCHLQRCDHLRTSRVVPRVTHEANCHDLLTRTLIAEWTAPLIEWPCRELGMRLRSPRAHLVASLVGGRCHRTVQRDVAHGGNVPRTTAGRCPFSTGGASSDVGTVWLRAVGRRTVGDGVHSPTRSVVSDSGASLGSDSSPRR
jgi:hypothetical protein